MLGALFGVGGPPYVVYIAGRIPDPTAQRAWAGVWTGNRVHMRVAPTKVAHIVGAVLLFNGASLIVRAL